LVQVITSLPAGRPPFIWEEGELRLTLPTPEQADASKGRGFGRYPRRDLRFLGSRSVRDWPRPEPAEVDGDTLYLGSRAGLDVSPTALGAEGASERRVWGGWRDRQNGFVIAVEPVSHEALRTVAGSFCAEWLGP
jgi:hypothetical protein